MARHYSPRSFFRHAPNAMLKRYFDKHGALTEYDFSEVTEKNIEPIYQAWLSLPSTQRGEMERDFREIDALAAGGVKAIIDEAAYHGEDLGGILSEHDSFHEKAFWVFLERPKYWPAARAFCHADSIGSSQWNESRTKDHPPARTDDASIQNLEKTLIHYFNEEGRGKNCKVDCYKRGKLDYFFAYPEDYAEASIEWDGPKFNRPARHPAFEIIFVYSEEDGKISLYMKGDKDTKKEVRALFADSILGLVLGDFVEDVRVYELAQLQDSNPAFKFSPDSGIQSVAIKKFRLSIDGTQERITLEANPKRNHNAIYELRDKLCKTIPLSQMTITQVGVLVTFVPDPVTGKVGTRSFEVNLPNSCSLRHDGKDGIIRKMLIDSGIEQGNRLL